MDTSLPGLEFPSVCGHKVVASFDGGDLTSDGGVLLVRQADEKIGLTQSMSDVFTDRRQQSKVRHDFGRLLSARVYGIACGYEDANDHDSLRTDPSFKVACGILPLSYITLASQPTISRVENAVRKKDLLRMAYALAGRVIAQLPADTRELFLDIDATDDPCHGQQEFEFFNRHYDCHCYLPLLLHLTGPDGRQWTLASLLRSGKASYRDGLFGVLRRAVRLLRARFPDVNIVLRADAGFGYWDTLAFCEEQKIDYILGLSTNKRLAVLSTPVQMNACLKYKWEGDGCREYGEFNYKAGKWKKERRVIVKAEITRGCLNPRYVVTNRTATPEEIYLLYCERGDRENRIKEMKLDLQSGRTSCHSFLANQMRLLEHNAACVLLSIIQIAAEGTRYACAQIGTLRVRIFKVAARVVQTCRRICFHLPTSYVDKDVWHHLNRRLSQPTA